METTRPMVMIAGQLPVGDYERLVALARVRGMMTRRTSRPNVSAALREAVALGLRVAEQGRAGEAQRGV